MQVTIENAIKIASMSKDLVCLLKLKEDFLTIEYCSLGIPSVYGYNLEEFEEIKKKNAFSFVSEYDVEFIKRGFYKAKETGEDYTFSVQVKHKNGGYVFLSGNATYIGSEVDGLFFYLNLSDLSGKVDKNKDNNLLFENEKRYRDAIDFAKIITWDIDLTGNKLINDNFFLNFLGNTQINNFSKDFVTLGIIDYKDASEFLRNIESLHNGVSEISFECWYHFPFNNTSKYIKSRYLVEFDKNHNPIIAHGMGIDLTETKNAEITFAHRTNAVLRTTPESIATIQLNISENTCTFVSSTYSQMSFIQNCKTVDEFVTGILNLIKDKNESIHFANAFSRGSMLASFNSGNLQIRLDHHLSLKEKYDEWVRTIVEIVKNPLTSDIEAIVHINNIHKIKVIDSLINGTVQREFDFISLVYVKTNSYILINKFNHEIKDEKQGFVEAFKEEIMRQVQDPNELNRILPEIDIDNLTEKINAYGEYTLQYNSNPDYDKNRHYILRFSFLNSRKDIITISCRDTTRLYNEDCEQKKKLSDALYEAEKANRAKSDFLSLVSHDIRTPLNGIMGMTQLALEETDFEKVRMYLKKAETSSSFLLGLINDLLDMAKIEAGKIELKSEKYDFKELNEYINSVILPLCQKKNLQFSMEYSDIVDSIIVDKLRFNQILFNLLSNACKYTNDYGKVSLKINTEIVNDSLCIATFVVEDNGIGMTDEFQEHLFETFSQENRMNFTSNEGTGLGLSITQRIVNLMGGEITCVSEIDKGTAFTVQLTCAYINSKDENALDEAKETQTNNSVKDYSNKIFLLCEDNVINQEIAIEILSNLGAKVEVADDGEIGVRKFNESPNDYYSCVFMDIRMPNMDGLTASKEIRKLDRTDAKTVPIIAMTANAMSEDKMECIEAGMNAFIPKPINVKELYGLMEKLIK